MCSNNKQAAQWGMLCVMVIGDNFTRFFEHFFLTYTTQRQIDNWKAPINFDEKRRFKKMSQHLLYFYIHIWPTSPLFFRETFGGVYFTRIFTKKTYQTRISSTQSHNYSSLSNKRGEGITVLPSNKIW